MYTAWAVLQEQKTDGTAYTFVTEREQNKFASIEALLGKPVPKAKVPEQLGPTPAYQPRTRGGGSGGGGNRNQHGGGGFTKRKILSALLNIEYLVSR